MAEYIIGIDQSTQGTKVMLFDQAGRMVLRVDKPHAQLIDERGYVEHDPEEIYANLIELVRRLLTESGIAPESIRAVGISNQRETALAWDRSGKPVYNAIVWQCARGAAICDRIAAKGQSENIRRRTGLQLSPYFSAAKLAWIMENVPSVKEAALKGEILCGTMDSYLVYRLTGGIEFRTDYSNASRTQLFNITDLCWDEDILALFGIPGCCMAQLTDSDGLFGHTDFEGVLPRKVPIHGVMGDSHGALFGQGCLTRGMMKSTYGTGSSIMMNIGEAPIFSDLGVVTSLAWKTRGQVQYVLEGNINYTGAVISWLKNDVGLLQSAGESEELARQANPLDSTYLVPAFSGLGAPYWRSDVSAAFVGMNRTTGRAELVKAGVEAIAYQITDVVRLMQQEAAIAEVQLRVDGGPTRNKWLMQFQSDMLGCPVMVPATEELSGMGAAYAAGLGAGLYTEAVFSGNRYEQFTPQMEPALRQRKYDGWKAAVQMIL
ncbi:MAG: glycerol kinase [Aristaeellaceae bacterium]